MMETSPPYDPNLMDADEHSADAPILAVFPSAVVHWQKRGTLTVPPRLRQLWGNDGPERLWLRVGPEETLCLEPLWAPDPLFSTHDAVVAAPESWYAPQTLPSRWLDAPTILAAQSAPDHPARAWCRDCDAGFHPLQMDPVVIPELLHRLPDGLPTLTRPALARYVASVCTWTGVTLADRDFYLGVLAIWGASEAEWPRLVQRAREALDT